QSDSVEVYNTQHDRYRLNEDYVISFDIDCKNRIWLAYYSQGISIIDLSSQTITHYRQNAEDENSLLSNNMSTIAVYDCSQVFIGTNGYGLSVFNIDDGTFTNYTASEMPGSIISDNISKIYFAPNGSIWIGCWTSGLSIYDKRFNKFTHYKYDEQSLNSLSGKSVTGFAEDANGNIWISTDGGGIDCFDVKGKKFYSHKSQKNNSGSLTNNKVLSIITDNDGGLWAGMWNGGLNYFEIDGYRLKLKKRIDKIDPTNLNNSSVFELYIDPWQNLWVGTFQDDVYLYNKKNNRFTTLSELINFENDTINQLTVNNVFYDPAGYYWISTQDFGLLKADLVNRSHTFYHQDLTYPFGQPSQLVSLTYMDSKGRLWTGSNAGLSLFNKENETFKTYTVNDGLPDNNVVGMLEDEHGNFWISTNKGLSKISIIEQDPFPELKVRNYVQADGLQGSIYNRWAYFKSTTGEMYFGGINGFNVFHPDSITDNTVAPPVHLTEFMLFNKPVYAGKDDSPLNKQLSQTEELVLKHKQNYFTIRFVALNYIMSEKNEYAYILEGLDNDWNYVGTRNEATYTHVRPGKYLFRVKACNNDGYWNEEGTSVKITIRPPWWQTWLFKILVGLLMLGVLVYLAVKVFSHYRQLANQTILNERNQIQTLIDNIPDQVYIKDVHSRFVVVNTRTAKQLGYNNPQSIIHKTDKDFFNPDVAEALLEQERQIMETGVSVINEESKELKNGKEQYLSTTKCPIINAKGETIGLVGIIRDITEQKLAELQITAQSRELKKMNKNLSETNQLLEITQKQIEEQAEELYMQKEELLNNNTELNKLIATKDKLFSIIAHDVRTPFSIIIGFSELFLYNMDKWDKDEKRNAAQIIYDSSSELSVMLENLLQWARDQRGLVKCYAKTMPVEPFIQNQITFFKYNLLLKGQKITTRFTDRRLKILADPQLLDTVFRNLIGNAIKFTPKGGHIEIGAKVENDKAFFHVSDTGVGIPPEDIENLFSIEERKTTYGTENEKGTGLGLILVKEFIEKQGGTLWVESVVGEGSAFRFSLPLAVEG
ncbi:MAG: PAS domain-containing protein, partial [Prolixibacteraceae bacterium]|nr:PAS domain-containing protein [Prolixibacteraceae bacterium]